MRTRNLSTHLSVFVISRPAGEASEGVDYYQGTLPQMPPQLIYLTSEALYSSVAAVCRAVGAALSIAPAGPRPPGAPAPAVVLSA
eukprot:7976080-Pyramimonas_sp.AAC.1